MSKRPIKDKQMARLRRAVGRRALPAHIDLIDWLKTRGHAQTSGAARRLLEAGLVKSDSHTVGRVQYKSTDGTVGWRAAPLVPAAKRRSLRVEAAR